MAANKKAKAKVEKETPAEGAAPKAKKERPVREKKDSYLKDNYVTLNDFRDEKGTGIVTKVMHIRSRGCQVREEAYEAGKLVSVSSNFIDGVKVKTKKDWKYLLIDKGPKTKKAGAATEEEEDEENDQD